LLSHSLGGWTYVSTLFLDVSYNLLIINKYTQIMQLLTKVFGFVGKDEEMYEFILKSLTFDSRL